MRFLAMSKIDLQKHLLAIVLLASLAPYQVARAQQPLHFPSPELAIPGVAQKSPISAPDDRCYPRMPISTLLKHSRRSLKTRYPTPAVPRIPRYSAR